MKMNIKDTDIVMIDKYGNVERTFKNYSEATKALGISGRSLIGRICREEYGSCAGYYWLTGKSYKKKLNNLTFDSWLTGNVKITKNINRDTMPIVKLDKLTYELIDRYPSLNEAARINGLDNKNGYDAIIKCCKFTRRTAKGYVWLLAEDYDSMSMDEIKELHNEINNINPSTKKINKHTMPVVKLDKNDFSLIEKYSNIIEAAKANDMDKKTGYDGIIRCCRFGRKSANGFAWLLEDDYNNMSADEIAKRYNGEKPSFVTDRRSLDKTPIVQLRPNTYEFVRVFQSIASVADELDLNKSGISKCCKFQRKSSGGYCWMYLDDFNKYTLEEIKELYGKIFWN